MPEVFFNGPAGRIEGRYTKSENKKAPVALVLHPHPLYNGTMNNKVVYSMYRTFAENNFSVLRINFRGVGRSQGEYDHGIGELTDATTALDWLQLNHPDASHFWIAGFSFGSWIGMQLMMRRPEVNAFVAASPPVNRYDFSFVTPCPIPGLIIQGDVDSIVSESNVLDFVDKLSNQKYVKVDYRIIKGGDHFYRTKMDEFKQALDEYLKANMNIERSSGPILFPDSSYDEDDEDDNLPKTSKGSKKVMLDDFF